MYCTRREMLRGAVAAAGLGALSSLEQAAQAAKMASAPSAPVAIGRCATYDLAEVGRCLAGLVKQVGGLERLVKGKTVTLKVNCTGEPRPMLGRPPVFTFHTHPAVVQAAVGLMSRAGAKRVRIVESSTWRQPLQEFLAACGWDVRAVGAAGSQVEFEDTRNLGQGKRYSRLKVPGGGLVFPAFDLNHSYEDTEVFVSIPKLKVHSTAGVTVCMKNLFGITPNAIYGEDAGNEMAVESRGGTLHQGWQVPASGAPAAHPGTPRRDYDRVPRVVTDLVRARPIHLCIVDGISSITGGEGPWQWPVKAINPGLLMVGTNPVCTDAIAAAVMGYDPLIQRAKEPFRGDNHVALAAAAGLGTHDPAKIEVLGVPLKQARTPFGPISRGEGWGPRWGD